MNDRTPENEPSAAEVLDSQVAALKAVPVPIVKRKPKADDGRRNLHAEQLVDKSVERAGGGALVASFIGTMMGQLSSYVADHGVQPDWETLLIRGKRTERGGIEAGTHHIVPAGTLTLVLDITVKPGR